MPVIFDHQLQQCHKKLNCNNFVSFLHLLSLDILSEIAIRQRNIPKNVLMYGYCDDRLDKEYAGAHIKYCDLISKDKHHCYIEEDSLFQSPEFDLAVSNLSLQFANDFPKAIASYKKILHSNGLFTAALLGEHSLYQLKESFLYADQEVYGGAFSRVMPMIKASSALEMMKSSGFKDAVAHVEEVTVSYSSLLELLKDLRYMGFSNFLYEGRANPMSKRFLKESEAYYNHHYSQNQKLILTFDLIMLSGFA